MLVLGLTVGSEVHIGDGIVIKVLPRNGGQIKIGIEAPQDVSIRRAKSDGAPRDATYEELAADGAREEGGADGSDRPGRVIRGDVRDAG